MTTTQKEPLQVVIVTGLSGSGKSSGIHVLEDLGFYCIDNLPSVLLPRFLELCEGLGEGIRRVALGIDLRERAFFDETLKVIEQIRGEGYDVEVLFFDASDEVLVRRFSETRRPHPQAGEGGPIDGIRRERERLEGLRAAANRILDTSSLTVHQLREALVERYSEATAMDRIRIFLRSFGFKYGIPHDADMVFDVRFLPNPFFVAELRGQSGLAADVRAYVLEREETLEWLGRVEGLLRFLLPLFQREGKRYFTFAVGCTGGRHRSVAIVAELARRLLDSGVHVQIRNRDIDR